MPAFPKSVAPLPAFGVPFFSSPNNYGTANTTNFTYRYNVTLFRSRGYDNAIPPLRLPSVRNASPSIVRVTRISST